MIDRLIDFPINWGISPKLLKAYAHEVQLNYRIDQEILCQFEALPHSHRLPRAFENGTHHIFVGSLSLRFM